MREFPDMGEERRKLSPKSRWIARAIVLLMRSLSLTCRWRLHDPDGIASDPDQKPMIWIFWHNRIFVIPTMYRKFLRHRNGAVLTSASRDGEIIAAVISHFGCASIRGSSSRRGAAAMVGLKKWLSAGYDIAVVPDGPRGPRYRLGPGAVKLAEVTGASILPIRVEYGSAWTFKSWDRFRLPKPFTTVDIFLEPLIAVSSPLDVTAFEEERLRVERALNPQNETD